ncbi:hypothetical protein [Kitasatospora sp. NRRL B-11411]|uniref:hypothetical protein n=1 Tax=Kitasatospora sp. NRRL B-11411 TaxID=1463822 RepID=UPI00068A481C|nr:hypothetical protein [Kitasatospora sp. NRRL B-11411]
MRSWRRRSQAGRFNDHSAVAEGLEIPVPFTIEKLCENVAAMRGRKIHIHAIEHEGAANSSPCGAWIALENSDHIFVESATSRLHRDHIILHELCHMLLDHSCLPSDAHAQAPAGTGQRHSIGEVLSVEEWAGFPMNRIVSLLGRTSYTHEDEQSAEGLAGILAKRIHQAEENASRPVDPLANHLLSALIE